MPDHLPQHTRCPRCDATVIIHGALSRATRDDGAEIFVCSRCGEREALREHELGDVIGFQSWPVEVDALLLEERLVIENGKRSTFSIATITPEDAQRMLDDDS